MLVVPGLPARSVTVAVMVFGPSARATPERLKPVWSALIAAVPAFMEAWMMGSFTVPVTGTSGVLSQAFAVGDVIAGTGKTVSRLTMTLAVPLFPARSTAVTVIVFAPSISESAARLKLFPADGVTAVPLTVRDVTGSFMLPATVIGDALTNTLLAGVEMVITGA